MASQASSWGSTARTAASTSLLLTAILLLRYAIRRDSSERALTIACTSPTTDSIARVEIRSPGCVESSMAWMPLLAAGHSVLPSRRQRAPASSLAPPRNPCAPSPQEFLFRDLKAQEQQVPQALRFAPGWLRL
eukprot:CAMPEP_0197926232 /NCGR_PEP_ID=MMETSP1439-20131203/98804_1 /TAXON_ID=66791 /ORGANISM="Gonyaulax spinifera, Strain CCMP409" /LENGTH=132 /DNA_ID=CAMNT_0043548757 /DNA_START=194 /DNA_END=593 /DNA_ORIENTATION=-